MKEKDDTKLRVKITNPDIPFDYLGEDLDTSMSPYDFMDKNN